MTRGAKRVLAFLQRDRSWHTSGEVEAECQVTAHSRFPELREAGHVIEKRHNHGATGRAMYSYRLIQTADEVALQSESLAELEGQPAAPSSSASDEEGRSVVDGVGVEGSAAAATTPAPERPSDESQHVPLTEGPLSAIDESGPSFAAVPYHGDCGSTAAKQTPAAVGPAEPGTLWSDDPDYADTAWRELFDGRELDESLPPPSQEQLELPEAVS